MRLGVPDRPQAPGSHGQRVQATSNIMRDVPLLDLRRAEESHSQCKPEDVDGGFVGYPCVDLSSLNAGPDRKFRDSNTATGKGYANMLEVALRVGKNNKSR